MMADDVDRATEWIERRLEMTLKQRKEAGPVAVGYCHACSEPLPGDLRFCDAECRDLFQDLHDRKLA